jgi:hypothetical protein
MPHMTLISFLSTQEERPVRRVCVTNIVSDPQGRATDGGHSSSTQFLMAVLIAALAAAAVTLGAMLGWHIDA